MDNLILYRGAALSEEVQITLLGRPFDLTGSTLVAVFALGESELGQTVATLDGRAAQGIAVLNHSSTLADRFPTPADSVRRSLWLTPPGVGQTARRLDEETRVVTYLSGSPITTP